jgi:glycosyltransferase involved in cell wall biosynthesis
LDNITISESENELENKDIKFIKEYQELKEMENVYFLGYKPYQQLPNYLHKMDVGLLPTLNNQYTKHMFPMKYYEYIASGLPIASTSLAFIDKNHGQEVEVGDSKDEYIQAIHIQLNRGRLESKMARQIVADNTWETRLKKILKIIENAKY